jgi:hypothetical protein
MGRVQKATTYNGGTRHARNDTVSQNRGAAIDATVTQIAGSGAPIRGSHAGRIPRDAMRLIVSVDAWTALPHQESILTTDGVQSRF